LEKVAFVFAPIIKNIYAIIKDNSVDHSTTKLLYFQKYHVILDETC